MNDLSRTLSEFRHYPFVSARYEQIGERRPVQSFQPMTPETIESSEQKTADPLFYDYGGGLSTGREYQTGSLNYEETTAEGGKNSAEVDSDQFQQMLEEAHKRGFVEGQSDARSGLEPHMAELRDRMNTLCDELAGQVQGEIERIERQAIGLAILISRRIIGEAVEINPEYLLPIVREALGYVGGAEVHRVRISPADLEFVEIERIRERFDGSWLFVADPSILSGCIIETNAGEVDFRLDAAWDRLKENILRSVTG